MRIRTVTLKKFKRFDDLTIDLGDTPAKVVALVGPNGCGKSSIFDAFEEKNKDLKHTEHGAEDAKYFGKGFYASDPAKRQESYTRADAVKLVRLDETVPWDHRNIYIRTAYRYTASLRLESIQQQQPVLEDRRRPRSMIATDTRLPENYARLQSLFWDAFEDGKKTGDQIKSEVTTKINESLTKVLDIKISSLGNVTKGKGQLFFEKDGSTDFPFENLSSGEKEVVDLLIDLFVKTKEYNDTVFCIDEPELHLNTAIQRKLLTELVTFIPANCQLWVATHSIGFLRALQEDLKDDSQVIDFSAGEYFKGAHVVPPMTRTRTNWLRVFRTALEDITGLLAPQRIIYCEGRPDPDPAGEELGLDARVYNTIFAETQHDTLFVSSGGTDAERNNALALKVLSKAFQGVELWLLKDRDLLADAERTAFLGKSTMNRMLLRRDIENYLYDPEVVERSATAAGIAFDRAAYDAVITDVARQDMKLAPVPETVQRLSGTRLGKAALKEHLATFCSPGIAAYDALRLEIFG